MREPLELVIFDCDGVLVDSERLAVRIDAAMLGELGWPISEEEVVHRFVGRSYAAMTAEIEDHLGTALPNGWEAELNRRYATAIETELTPVDGIVEALDELTVPTCVASSGSHETMRRSLGRTGLYGRFAGRIFSATEVPHGKPAPDLFLHAAARMGVSPDRCTVIEDSQYGVRAARAAKMRVLGYAAGVTPASWLVDEGAEVFTDMRELPALLGYEGAAT